MFLENVIKCEKQGYAFYYKNQNLEIKEVNGILKDDEAQKISFDSHFRLASVTKQFIARGIIELFDIYDIKLQDSPKKFFPELPNYFQNITIKQLLNHTSGVYDYEDMPHNENQIHDIDILTFLNTTNNTYFPSGTMFKYSNTGYILLSLIIEKVSNMPIDVFLQKNVFSKAHLTDTLVNYEGKTHIKDRAYGHILLNGELIVKDQYWCSATIGDGGIYSTVNDLNKWIDFLLKDANKLMFETNYLPNGINTEYGFGMRIIECNNQKIYYHCGDTIGTNTLILFNENMRLIFLTNHHNIDTAIIKDNLLNYLSVKK